MKNPSGPDQDRAQALAEVEQDFPFWHCWQGTLPHLLYARRPNSSPPMVVRAVTTDELRQAIEAAERERGLR